MARAAQRGIALVTGANKGIGLGVCQDLIKANFRVLLGSRNIKNGESAIASHFSSEDPIECVQVDLCDGETLTKTASLISKKYGENSLDVLVHNAGMAAPVDAFDGDVVRKTFKTNYFGTILANNAFMPLIKKEGGRIIFVSSRAGALNKIKDEGVIGKFLAAKTVEDLTRLMDQFQAAVDKDKDSLGYWPKSAYGTSKIGVSMYTRIMAMENPAIWMGAVCPGYVATDMSKHKGPRTLEQGSFVISELASMKLDESRPSGLFWASFYEERMKQESSSGAGGMDKQFKNWREYAEIKKIDWVKPSWSH